MSKCAIRFSPVFVFAQMFGSAAAAALNAGDEAPGFELQDQHGTLHKLADYRGQWLVLYFYPKDDTPGCTTEACAFRDELVTFRRMGVAVVGVSLDAVKSHEEFAKKYHLQFPLLSDAKGEVARSYGALFGFGPLKFARRHTFIIDPHGRIARIYRKVRPKQHSDQLIADLEELQE